MRFDGAPLDGRPFAFMPQRDALMPWRRVIDNTTLGLEVQGMRRRAAREHVAPLFAEFGLAGFERAWPAQLSGGMRQRAALLRTVVQQRDMLLLDEPFGALDALTRAAMQRWLEKMWRSHRWTALLITHDVREAVLLSDRIYVLSARPARVVAEVAVPLPRPRTESAAIAREAAAIETGILDTLLGQADPDTRPVTQLPDDSIA
jgi:ABC-type nitrate/sulfonate/bicarbonate transport system ATPase subunit